MTDRCEPPPEFRHEPLHWVESHKDGMGVCQFGIIPDVIQPDLRDYCRITSTRFVTFLTPQEACELGWRYVAPCRPDDATERVRLEAENARLRKWVLQMAPTVCAMADEGMIMDGCEDPQDVVIRIAEDLGFGDDDDWNGANLLEALKNA